MAEAFTHLGFPAYFRVELSWAKLLGVVLLLAPVPARLKEWAYAGFAINLGSALIAHLSVGDGPEAEPPASQISLVRFIEVFKLMDLRLQCFDLYEPNARFIERFALSIG